MCGILGIVNIENREPIPAQLLNRMTGVMRHRGPDGSGSWISPDGQVALGHRRLAIVDLSDAGSQPMASPDGKVWLTFNGEIYNFRELRAQLVKRGHMFRSDSDTEVILALYIEYGDRFHEFLDGDFGLGLWDIRRQRLFLARDQAGVKPLYFTHFDGRLLFASEIKSLIQYPGANRGISGRSLYDYLTYLVVPPPKTLLEGISKLEAASTMTLNPRQGFRPQVQKYWLPIPRVRSAANFRDLDAELREVFSASVKKRLMADVEVGVLYSGGVDSTLNLCTFSELTAPKRVDTFTVGMDNSGDFHDDSVIAHEMATKLGSRHHEIRISDRDLLNAAQRLAVMQDEPVSDPVAIPLYFVTRLAKEAGVTVLHAGEGADELFCGYQNYRRFLTHHRKLWQPLAHAPRAISGLAARAMSLSSTPRHRKIKDVLFRLAKGQELFMSSAVAYYEYEKQAVLSADFKESMKDADSFDVVAPFYERIREACPTATFLQQMTFIELQLRLPELLLMRIDKMSMANSIEVRVPFLDRGLMNFAMEVPDAYKLRDGISKEPVKRLAASYVSRETMYRPKTGFGVPIQQWFRGELSESLMDLAAEDDALFDNHFDRRAIEYRLKHGLRTVNEAFQLWVIYNLLVWHRGLSAQ